jgi:diacylglycerol kinase (ATP)
VKPNTTGVRRVINAAGYSLKGFKSAWLFEAAFRQEVALCIIFSIVAFMLPVSNIERIIMIVSLLLVVIVELINSAIEAVEDRIGDDWNELSGRAKDIGSAAVFLSLFLVLFVWVSILLDVY